MSLVVVNYGTPHLVAALLESLSQHPDVAFFMEAVIVENGFPAQSDCRSFLVPSEYAVPLRFAANRDSSYASGVNRGAELAGGEFLAVANSDLQWLREASVQPLIEALDRDPQAGIAGPQLVFPDGRWQASFGPFPSVGAGLRNVLLLQHLIYAWAAWRYRSGSPDRLRTVAFLVGAFMLIRRPCFDQLHGFDERWRFYAEDVDFCWRAARAGWRRLFVPAARLRHVRGGSSSAADSAHMAAKALAASRGFVRRHHGERRAKVYALLQLASAWQLFVLYRVIAALRPSNIWRQRLKLARDALAAARRLGLRLEPAPDAR